MWRRRNLLQALLTAAMLPRSLLARLRSAAAPDGGFERLAAYCDTLLPADEAPAASELGVHRRLLRQAEKDAELARALAAGLDWLDAEARRTDGRAFASLNESRREALLTRASLAPPGTLARHFFDLTRRQVFTLYYRDPGSWPALGYRGPPQPRGFPDHAEPPHDG